MKVVHLDAARDCPPPVVDHASPLLATAGGCLVILLAIIVQLEVRAHYRIRTPSLCSHRTWLSSAYVLADIRASLAAAAHSGGLLAKAHAHRHGIRHDNRPGALPTQLLASAACGLALPGGVHAAVCPRGARS